MWLFDCLFDVCNLFSINRSLEILQADEIDVAGQVLVSSCRRGPHYGAYKLTST